MKPSAAILYSPDSPEPIALPVVANGDAWRIRVELGQVRRYGAIKIGLGG